MNRLFFKTKHLRVFAHRLFSNRQNTVVCHLAVIDPLCYLSTASQTETTWLGEKVRYITACIVT